MRTAGIAMLALGLALAVEPPKVRADACEFVLGHVTREVLRIEAKGLEQGALDLAASPCAPVIRPKEGIRLDADCVGAEIMKANPASLVLVVKAADKLGSELSACRTAADPNKVELKLRMVEDSDRPVLEAGKVQLSDKWNDWFDPSKGKWIPLEASRTLSDVETTKILVMGPGRVAELPLVSGAPSPGVPPVPVLNPSSASSPRPSDHCEFAPRYKPDVERVEFEMAGLTSGALEADSSCALRIQGNAVSLSWRCFARLLTPAMPQPLVLGKVPDESKLSDPLRSCVADQRGTKVLMLRPRLRSVSIPAGVSDNSAVLDQRVAKAWPWILLENKREWEALRNPSVASEFIRMGQPVYAYSNGTKELALMTATTFGDWCQDAPKSALVCFDTTSGRNGLRWSPVRNVLQPNRGLVVRVLHARGQNVTVTVAGTRGLVESRIRGGKEGIERQREVGARQAVTSTMVSSFTFVPRKPGPADVTIETSQDAQAKVSATLELEVEELSWGAARFGFGALFGEIVSKTYEAQVVAGSEQLEIGVNKDPYLGWEVVLGFAPYLLDVAFCDGSGRSHTGGCNKYIAPYFGVGIVGDAPAGVSSFNALYLGAEFEFAPNFSVAATAVWRGVTTLRRGYAVQSAVEPGTQFTRSTTAFGFGLILNVTPDFLQFTTGTDAKATTSTATTSTQTPPAPPPNGAGTGQSGAGSLTPTNDGGAQPETEGGGQ